MKRITALFLTFLLVFIPSCSESADHSDPDRLTRWLTSLEGFTAQTVLTVDFPDRVVQFSLENSVSPELCTVKVTDPVEISGIEVTIAPGGVTASCDGASFEVGETDSLGVQPVTAVAELYRLFTTAAPRQTGRETLDGIDCLTAVYESGQSRVQVWFDSGDLAPVAGEFFTDGVRTIRCEFVSFAIGGS